MEKYQQRVLQEREELNQKLQKLHDFCESSLNEVATEEQDQLIRQRALMRRYLNVLDVRISAFSADERSTYAPDDTRRQRLQGFVGTVCVCSTGRLGIVTHIAIEYGQWTACGFGLDGKGVWTSKDPHEIATAEAFYDKLKKRFHGRLSALDGFLSEEIDNIAKAVVDKVGDREFFASELGETFKPPSVYQLRTESLAKVHEGVVEEVTAGADQRIGLGPVVEEFPPTQPPAEVIKGDNISRPPNVGGDFDNDF